MKAVFILGFALFALGWAHRLAFIARLDGAVFLFLHRALAKFTPTFQILWHLGRLPAALTAVVLVGLLGGIQRSAYSLAAYLIAAAVERGVKMTFRRPRPYKALIGAEMRQPREPQDPSFPSGDALRVWLFALALAAFLPNWASAGLFALAFIVSLGRTVLGVHYPLDVLAGSGLGLMAGSLLRILW